jgi:phosphate transport system substrate-binding protein
MIDELQEFGCTDAPMTDAQLKLASAKQRGAVIHVPLAMGAVVLAYNLPDIAEPLKLTGPVIADIYLGKVTKWNDPAIRANNPGVTLPDVDIVPIHRGDKSGTTAIFTDYLTKVSGLWRSKVGEKPVQELSVWPATNAKGGQKNNGVSEAVSRQIGAIGYIELSYALKNSLQYAHVKNRAGNYIEPKLETVTKAAAGILQDIPEDLRYSLTDATGEASYPISGTVWAIMYTSHKGGLGKLLAEFFWWATHDGQKYCEELQYAPLPVEMRPLIEQKLRLLDGSVGGEK